MYKTPPADDDQRELPEITYPIQRRRRAAASKQPASPSDYLADERPEIPRIKRASLLLKAQDADEPTTELPRRKGAKEKHAPLSTRHAHARRLPLNYLQYLGRNQVILALGLLTLTFLIIAPILAFAGHSSASATLSSTGTSNRQPPSVQQLPLNPHELVITPQDSDHPAPPVYATAAYLLDADTGATLYAHNPFMHLPMLSTTKLMTVVLAVEKGNPDQKITITDAINNDISKLSADSALFGVKKGETYTLREMLYGLLLLSGNDAAIAIADTIGGDLQNFVAMMNLRAHQLGLNDTHYVNPHGLFQTGQYSSARDLAILARYSLGLPLIAQISAAKTYYIPQGGNHPARYLINGNQFLWWYPGVIGGKTGYSDDDYVQVISAIRNKHHLIGVVIHTIDWWTDMRDLMNWGFDTFSWVSPHDSDIAHPPIPYDYLWNYFANDKKENTIPTADSGRYYIYTGYSISGPIMKYFDKFGGLKTFGYPMSMPKVLSASVVSQQFEKHTIECYLPTNFCQTI